MFVKRSKFTNPWIRVRRNSVEKVTFRHQEKAFFLISEHKDTNLAHFFCKRRKKMKTACSSAVLRSVFQCKAINSSACTNNIQHSFFLISKFFHLCFFVCEPAKWTVYSDQGIGRDVKQSAILDDSVDVIWSEKHSSLHVSVIKDRISRWVVQTQEFPRFRAAGKTKNNAENFCKKKTSTLKLSDYHPCLEVCSKALFIFMDTSSCQQFPKKDVFPLKKRMKETVAVMLHCQQRSSPMRCQVKKVHFNQILLLKETPGYGFVLHDKQYTLWTVAHNFPDTIYRRIME